MKQFPADVRAAMASGGVAVTCLPVRLDGGDWEAALFFQLAGSESESDLDMLARAPGPVATAIEADLLELQRAAVVVIRAVVYTVVDDPLVGEILLTPGGSRTHFDALQLLAQQQRLCWFFADQEFCVVHSQQHPVDAHHRASFDDLLRDAVRHDALIRASSRYDASRALADVVAHYELRHGLGVTRA